MLYNNSIVKCKPDNLLQGNIHSNVLLHFHIVNHCFSIFEFWVDNMDLFNTILHSAFPI